MLLHSDFYVNSIRESLIFYVDGMGFEIIDDFEVSGDLVSFISEGLHTRCRVVLLRVGVGSAMMELVEFLDATSKKIKLDKGSITILVSSLDEKILALQHKGINPISDIFFVDSKKLGGCRVVFYNDLDGNKIEFLEKVKKI